MNVYLIECKLGHKNKFYMKYGVEAPNLEKAKEYFKLGIEHYNLMEEISDVTKPVDKVGIEKYQKAKKQLLEIELTVGIPVGTVILIEKFI